MCHSQLISWKDNLEMAECSETRSMGRRSLALSHFFEPACFFHGTMQVGSSQNHMHATLRLSDWLTRYSCSRVPRQGWQWVLLVATTTVHTCRLLRNVQQITMLCFPFSQEGQHTIHTHIHAGIHSYMQVIHTVQTITLCVCEGV